MKKQIYCLLVMICPCVYGNSQAIKPLEMGAISPDLPLTGLINYKSDNARLSDFAGKLVILDFWATWCGSCIKEFSRMDSLQRAFGDSIAIIAVTSEPREKLVSFIQKHPIAANRHFLYLADDLMLRQYFPYRFVPHDVWLKNGRQLYAVTGPRFVNGAYIRHYFDGRPYSGKSKTDMVSFNYDLPFEAQDNDLIEKQLLVQSALLGPVTGAGTQEGIVESDGFKRRYFINMPLLHIYQSLLPLPFFGRRIVLEVADSSRYVPGNTNDEDWLDEHGFCYEIKLPANTVETMVNLLAAKDLDSKLNVWGRIETRALSCYLLANKKGSNPAKKPGGISMKELLMVLNNEKFGGQAPLLFVDETNSTGNMYEPIDAGSIGDTASLLRELRRQGLIIRTEKRRMKVFVLTEIGFKQSAGIRRPVPNY